MDALITLDEKEIEKIEKLLPGSQRPIHVGFHAKVRAEKKQYDDAICTLSSHLICVFVPSNNKEDLGYRNVMTSHISLVSSILIKDESVVIGLEQKTLKIETDYIYEFAQILYRNYYLSFLFLGAEEDIDFFFNGEENDDEKEKLFPPLDLLPVSPSQQFQFNYFANCTDEEKARYNHAAVRYVHSMITTGNTIFDASMLPDNLLNGKNAKENLRQIFAVLSMMKTVSGICLSNYNCPDIINTFSSLIPNLKSLRIVHLSDCGATTGLDELAESIINANNLNVSYWDLSYNKFKDFKPFSKIISNSKKAIKYINLNYCEISHSGSTSFFNALSSFKHVGKLRYLSIAKMSISNEDSITAFRNFLKVSNLSYIDISSMEEEISAVLKALTEEEQPNLRSLILNQLPLDEGTVILINKLIENSNTLEELSLSGSNISPDNLATIITTINENKNIKSFSLNLDNLNLGGNLNSVLDAFLSPTSNKSKKKTKKKSSEKGNDNNDDYALKWKKLSFASNSLDENDLDDLINSISNFNELVEINLDNNFNSSMQDIENILCNLLDFKNLVNISVAGSKKNRLKGKLAPLMSAIAKSGNIQKLDIRNNDFNDISCIKKLIKNCKDLSVFRLDNNGFSDIEEIVSEISKIKKLVEFNFPLNDCKKIVKNNDDPDDKLITDIENSMRDLMEIVQKNRVYCELPFKTSEDVEQLISDLSSKAQENLDHFDPEKTINHSYITEIFGLPFPCQKLLMLLRNERDKSSLFSNRQKFYKKSNTKQYGKKEIIKMSKGLKRLNKCYFDSDSMSEMLVEYPENACLYPEFFTNPIVGWQIKEFFDNLIFAQDKESENRSTEDLKKKNKSKRLSSSGKIAERGAKLSNSESDDYQDYDESSSNAPKKLKITQRYLIRGKDNQAEDEKTRIQLRNANLREVEDISLNLETRVIDNKKLDQLMGSSSDEIDEAINNRSKLGKSISINNRAKNKEPAPQETKATSSKRSRIENNYYNRNEQRRRTNDNDDEDSDKDKSIIMKRKKILSNPDYANQSSDDEHIEKLRRQNLRGSGKGKTDQKKQPNPQPQPQPQPQPPKPIQKKGKIEEEEEENENQKKPVNKRRVIIPSSESSSDDDNVPMKNQKISRKNVNDSENDEEEETKSSNKERKPINNRSIKQQQQQQVSSSSSDSENNEEANKRSRKRSSNSQQRKQQQQQEEQERKQQQEEQERRKQQQEQERKQQEEEERRKQQQEEQERRKQQQEEEEKRRLQEEEQERLRQLERKRQQQQQEEEEKQQKISKKQTPPPPSKKDQTLRGLLNSSSEELSNSDEDKNKVPPKRASQNQRSIQKPPNQPDPGLAMNYAHDLLEENEKKPRASKIPLYRKT